MSAIAGNKNLSALMRMGVTEGSCRGEADATSCAAFGVACSDVSRGESNVGLGEIMSIMYNQYDGDYCVDSEILASPQHHSLPAAHGGSALITYHAHCLSIVQYLLERRIIYHREIVRNGIGVATSNIAVGIVVAIFSPYRRPAIGMFRSDESLRRRIFPR